MLFDDGIDLLFLLEQFVQQTPTSVQESNKKNFALAFTFVVSSSCEPTVRVR
jgi:hypothetical protein